MEKISIAELARTYGRKADTLYRKAGKEWPERKPWSIYSEVTETEGRILLGDIPNPNAIRRKSLARKPSEGKPAQVVRVQPENIQNVSGNSGYSEKEPEQQVAKQANWQRYILIGLLIAPTVASVENMYHVTRSLAGTAHSAVLLTIVLSISALGFVVASKRSTLVMALALLLIGFESFCNLTRVYGGLLNVGTPNYGLPVRFLGLVTDIFGTGTHQTAVFLAAFTAFFIAAVQYAAVYELKK